MQIAILCGGLGTRLKPLTEKVPKTLLEVQGKPFLEHVIERLKNNGILDLVLCTGYLGEKLQEHFGNGSKFGVNLKYSQEAEPLGTAGALKNAESLLEETFMVMYGDTYLPIDFREVYDYFKNHNKTSLMVVRKTPEGYSSNVAVSDELISKYDKEDITPDMEYMDFGLLIFKKEILKLIPEGKSDLVSALQELVSKKELLAFVTEKMFNEFGSLESLERINQEGFKER
ncbi:MAG: sugar phosphate nucleotidyltransferase [archaeon]